MLLRSLILFALTYGTLLVSADEASDQERCVEAIFEAYSHLSFAGPRSQPYPVKSCTNTLRTWSIYAAVKVYCTPAEIEPGLAHINEPCQGDLARTPYTDIEPELTDGYIRGLRVVEYGEVPKAVELNSPVLISKAYFEASVRTNAAWSLASRMHRIYGAAAYWFWGGVLLLGILNNVSTHWFHSRLSRPKGDIEDNSKSPDSVSRSCIRPFRAAHHFLRTNFIIPAAFGSHHQRLFYYCTIPTRMEAVPVLVYYTLSFVFMVVSYDIFEGNLYWNDTSDQMWRYVSDRTGIMSYANLCLLWLFGGRNNPFLWATGWGFSTFNLFHRTIARVATIQAIVHSVGYTILVLKKNTYFIYLPMPWWYMGIAATVCMSLLLLFSSIYLRKNYYELFLLIHISLSLVTIGGLFIHTAIFSGAYDIYLWPVAIVWFLDRMARIVRLVYCNVHIQLYRGEIMRTEGTLSYDKTSDMIRLEITPGTSGIEPKPGQHYYIYQPLKWRGYESHPFTLGAWTIDNNEMSVFPTRSPFSETPNDSESSKSAISVHANSCSEPEDLSPILNEDKSLPARHKLIFWIRPFDGWTKRLRNECLRSPRPNVDSTFLIEGPYGQASPVHNYENVILIAGGSGIAGALPYIEDHILRARSSLPRALRDPTPESSSSSATLLTIETNILPDSNTTRTRHTTLVWAARQRAFLYEIGCRELRPALARADFDARLYATREREGSAEDTIPREETNSLTPSESTKLLQGSPDSGLNIAVGRPDIKSIILEIVSEAGSAGLYSGRTAVLVCGPGSMADEARLAVHQALKEGYREVEYFEEAFGW